MKIVALAMIGLTIGAARYTLGAQQSSQPQQSSAAPSAQPSRSVWDGVYTEEQAKRGEPIYGQHCARCHGESLLGGSEGAGPLVGATFTSNWNGVNLGDMLERTRVSMPLDQPGRLTRQQNADVLAYIFSVNRFPAGKTELARQTELLSQIRFQAIKP